MSVREWSHSPNERQTRFSVFENSAVFLKLTLFSEIHRKFVEKKSWPLSASHPRLSCHEWGRACNFRDNSVRVYRQRKLYIGHPWHTERSSFDTWAAFAHFLPSQNTFSSSSTFNCFAMVDFRHRGAWLSAILPALCWLRMQGIWPSWSSLVACPRYLLPSQTLERQCKGQRNVCTLRWGT